MPSAPRERKPALAAVAILLVALGAASAGYLVLNAGHRVGAVEITQDVGQGQQIPASAIKEVQINADTDVHYVAWQFASRVTGVFARVQIPAGTLLTSNMTASTSNLTAGKVEVGLSLKPGQAPTNLLIGQTVRAFPVGTGSGCGGGTNGTGGAGVGATPGEPITTGTIVSVAGSTATNGSTAAITLAVPETDAGVLACYASAQDVAIALTPGSG
jgi:hypothetical protein